MCSSESNNIQLGAPVRDSAARTMEIEQALGNMEGAGINPPRCPLFADHAVSHSGLVESSSSCLAANRSVQIRWEARYGEALDFMPQ